MAVKMRVWTAEENERLKAFVAKGVSIIKVAAAFKRKTVSVRNQARKLGRPFPSTKEYRKKIQSARRLALAAEVACGPPFGRDMTKKALFGC
jgi:hypothetical protein